MPFEVRKKCEDAASAIQDKPKEYREKDTADDEFMDIAFTEIETDHYTVDGKQLKLPKIIYLLMEFIKGEHNGKKFLSQKENSFRLNGNLSKKDEILMHLQLGNYEFLERKENKDCSHEVCTLLKQVILEFSEPMIPHETFEAILERIREFGDDYDKYQKEKVEIIIDVFKKGYDSGDKFWKLRMDTLFYISKPLIAIS